MNFAHPGILGLAALVAPLLGLFFAWSWRARRRLIARFVPRRLQESLTLGLSPGRATARALLLITAITALLLALARPRYGSGSVEIRQRGLDIVLAIDTSRSMLAEDAGPGISRLKRARLAALDLARLAQTDRLGLVAFAGSAFLQCPLTADAEAFRQSVEALDTAIIPQGGTALSPGIRTALEAFTAEGDNVRVLLLFTDGEEHEPGAVEAARRAREKGLLIFTVGIGTARGEIIRLQDAQGAISYLKDSAGNVVKSSLNEPLLREVAQAGGGFYLPLQGPRAIEDLYQLGLQPLPKSDLDSRLIDQFHERFQWPLGLALLLLLAETLLPERPRPRGSPRPVRLAHPSLAGSTAAALALLLALPTTAFASAGSALKQFEAADYSAARAEYERLARQKPADPRLRFNAGTAAYRDGDFSGAADHFQKALNATDLRLQEDAYYNLGNARFRAGEGSSDTAARRTAWEQSIGSYEAALKLDPANTNAQHNLDYVQQRLEELKQQQQQQDKQDGKRDKQEQQDPSSQDQKPESQPSSDPQDNAQSQQQPQQDPGKDPQDPEDNAPSPSDNPPDSKPKDDPKSQTPKPDRPQGDSASAQKPDPGSGKDAPAETGDGEAADAAQQAATDRMTPQQALRLLDAARAEEKMVPLGKRRATGRVFKDW